jgi:hypothetical protein
MLREGPIPRFLHGVLEYIEGVLFIAAPFLFGFDEDTAVALSLIVGVVLLVVAASTDGPSSMVNQVPLTVHVAYDYLLAVLLIVMPFGLGFSDEAASTAFFLIMGVGHLMLSIGTRFRGA